MQSLIKFECMFILKCLQSRSLIVRGRLLLSRFFELLKDFELGHQTVAEFLVIDQYAVLNGGILSHDETSILIGQFLFVVKFQDIVELGRGDITIVLFVYLINGTDDIIELVVLKNDLN